MRMHIASEREIDYIHSLYVRAFPPAERKPFEILMRLRRRGICDLYLITCGGENCGFAAVHRVKDIALLDYFAIDDRFRGRGLGGMALDVLTDRYRNCRFFIEIERVEAEADNHAERAARKRFYLQHGFVECGIFARMWGVDMEILSHDRPISWLQCRRAYLTVNDYRWYNYFKVRRIK